MLEQTLRGITLLYVIVLTLLLELPTISLPKDPTGGGVEVNAHVVTFTLLGLLVELCRRKKSVFFWIGALLCYSLSTEVLQGLLHPICHRYFDWHDLFHDVIGVLLGIFLIYFIRTLFFQRNLPKK
jgi:glycopeptide antibiotics resistance protein